MRALCIFFLIGGLSFAAKRSLLSASAEPRVRTLTVHVAEQASDAERERAIDEALLVEHAVEHGGAWIDPVVREQLLRGMRASLDGERDDDGALITEALSLGIHRADPVARQRLLFQAEQLLTASAASETPRDEALHAYMSAHAERYRTPARISLSQLFLSRARHGDALASDAERLLASLVREAASPEQARTRGDSTLLPRTLVQASERELDSRFGHGFFAQLARLPTGGWSGPVRSSFGLHVVFVQAHLAAALPELTAQRARVLADYRQDRRRALLREQLRVLRARYRIELRRRSA